MNRKVIGSILALSLSACSTATKSTLLGATIAGVVGGAIGQNHSHDSQGTAVGALIGAGLGSLIGYSSFNDSQKRDDKFTPAVKEEDLSPLLTKPRIRSYVVPDTIEGNKYIKSHRVFILEDPGSWSR